MFRGGGGGFALLSQKRLELANHFIIRMFVYMVLHPSFWSVDRKLIFMGLSKCLNSVLQKWSCPPFTLRKQHPLNFSRLFNRTILSVFPLTFPIIILIIYCLLSISTRLMGKTSACRTKMMSPSELKRNTATPTSLPAGLWDPVSVFWWTGKGTMKTLLWLYLPTPMTYSTFRI